MGLYRGSTNTDTPTRMVLVSAAAWVRSVSESKQPAWSRVLLVTHRSLNPRASARCATWRTTAASMGSGERCGRDIPSAIWSFRAMRASPAERRVGRGASDGSPPLRRPSIAGAGGGHKPSPPSPLHLQQPLGVAAQDLGLVLRRELEFVHPLRPRDVLHEGPVHREQDTVGTQFHHRAE